MLLFWIITIGFTQNLTVSNDTINQTYLNRDSVMNLIMDKNEAYLFRRYITELEFQKVSFDLTKEELALTKYQSTLWEHTAANYKKELEIADFTLQNQVELQGVKDIEINKQIKQAKRKGIRNGAIVASVVTLILCLLVK